MKTPPGTFGSRASLALANAKLQRNLQRGTTILHTNRELAYAAMDDGAGLRVRAQAIRAATLARLDEHLATFVANAEAVGCTVHYALDAAEANQIALDIARTRGCKLAVKTKSMVTEEIELVEHFAANGIRALETDFGEWIIQQAHDRPSHLILPALHKDRHDIAELMTTVLEHTVAADPAALMAAARSALRKEFIAADLGITGCNFAVAETGSLIIVTNEGNGRLVTAGPPIHIAFVPIEKVVPTLDDAIVLMRSLIGSAVGRKLTSTVSILTGPRRTGERDGPSELHLILLDNHRSEAFGTALEETLACIRCGACLNACPVYRSVGGHAYGSVYPGPIGIPVTTLLAPERSTYDLGHASSLCGACFDACPVRIDIPRLILETRRVAVERRRAPLLERVTFRCYGFVLRHPRLYRLAMIIAAWIGVLFASEAHPNRIDRLPGPLSRWTATRTLPRPASTPFHTRFARRHGKR